MSNSFDNQPYGQDGFPHDPAQGFNQGYGQQPYPMQQPGYGQQQGFAQMQPQVGYAPVYPEQKSWLVTLLLCFFLGTLGIHNFYLGYTGRGIGQLILAIVGWGLTATFFGAIIGIPMVAVLGVWVLVDFIMIVVRGGAFSTDSRRIPLK